MVIALDLASYNVVETNLAGFREVVENYVDILFANEEEARAFTGKGPEESLEELSSVSGIAIVKAGSSGSWIRRGDETLRIGTEEINVVDTTGAGDLYAAGFLYGYCTGSDLETCGELGSIAAGKVIEVVGAKIGNETWMEMRESFSRIIGG